MLTTLPFSLQVHICSRCGIDPVKIQDRDFPPEDGGYALSIERKKASRAPRNRIRQWLNDLPHDMVQTCINAPRAAYVDEPLEDCTLRSDDCSQATSIQPGDSQSCRDPFNSKAAQIEASKRWLAHFRARGYISNEQKL